MKPQNNIMKRFFFLFSILFILEIQAQPIQHNQLNDIIASYMDYFQEYDPLAPEPLRKAKFNKIVDKENPNLSKTDRERAFKIVDSYIRADKGLNTRYDISEKDKQLINNMWKDAEKQKQKGLQGMMNEMERYQNMSYDAYKAMITQNGQIPFKEADIKKAFNQMHKNDGKQVAISPGDNIKTKQLTQIEAIEIMRYPDRHTFAEYKSAIKLLKPNITNEEIQEYWQKIQH